MCSGTDALMLYDQMGLEFPNYQSYDQLARSFGRYVLNQFSPAWNFDTSNFQSLGFRLGSRRL